MMNQLTAKYAVQLNLLQYEMQRSAAAGRNEVGVPNRHQCHEIDEPVDGKVRYPAEPPVAQNAADFSSRRKKD
jgi:hypothetical protein